jgi:hypothetical protein
MLLPKPSNAVERCVGEWLRDVDGSDLYFPPCSDVTGYSGFYTEEEIHGSGWQIGYTVKHDLAQGKRELAETIAKAPAAYCNYSMLMQKDYEDSLDNFGSVMAQNMGKGWNFDANGDVFKLFVGKYVTQARWAPHYAKSLGTDRARALERYRAVQRGRGVEHAGADDPQPGGAQRGARRRRHLLEPGGQVSLGPRVRFHLHLLAAQ